jgi:hypothetical protein
MKLIAGLCWFIFGISQFYFFGPNQTLAAPLMILFVAFGMFFVFSMFDDHRKLQKDKIWNFDD